MTYTSAKVAEVQATLNQELSSYEESPRNKPSVISHAMCKTVVVEYMRVRKRLKEIVDGVLCMRTCKITEKAKCNTLSLTHYREMVVVLTA